MPDREKVIRAFEQYVYNFVELTTTDEYNHQILEQVLVLLKEQEAVKPFSDDDGAYWCGSCHEDLVWHQKFCSNCGRPVLWEGR